MPRMTSIDLDNADPTAAVNAFLHNLNKQRSIGLTPRTEHVLAEHLLRGDAKIIFYSSMSGILSICMDDTAQNDFDDDATFDLVMNVLRRRSERRKAQRAKLATEAASDMDEGGDAEDGSMRSATAGQPNTYRGEE